MTSDIDITHIVNSSILQAFPDAFYKATGFATGIHNLSGGLITSIPRENFCTFCRNMFFSRDGHSKCLHSNIAGDKVAFESSKPYIYHCHAGLTDISAPIIVNKTHVGSITFGQLITRKLDDRYRDSVKKRLAGFPKKFQEKQMAALEDVPYVTLKQVKGLAQLLSLIANNIVNLVISNINEKELNIRNIELIKEITANSLLEKEIRNARLQLKEVELRALQAQINPHFLYNTLDSIKWLAVLHGVDDIQQIVVAMGKLLRYSLSQEHSTVTISTEIEEIENYLMIQKFRYGEKISYKINFETEVLEFRIPKLLLQPLVENAIQHGLEPKPDSGNIWISGWLEDSGHAVIEVADDGVGISDDIRVALTRTLLNNINESEPEVEENNHSRIGLMNVNKRLVNHFGENSALKIEGRDNTGTVIRFLIPRRFIKLQKEGSCT